MTDNTKDNNNKQVALNEHQQQTSDTVANATTKTALNAVQQMQTDVIKFVGALLGQDRAKEFATRVALIARENYKLADAIAKRPDAFLTALMDSATLDLMPNTPQGDAYLIPYGDKVQFQTGYNGLIKLARRSGQIKTISAELVFKGDEFEVDYGTERRIIHRPNFDADRTNYQLVTHAYATARLLNGEDVFVVLTRKELDKVKSTAKASSTDSPWQTWPEAQARKTALKRLTKVLPKQDKNDPLAQAAAIDSAYEAGKVRKFDQKHGAVIEGEEVGSLKQETIDAIAKAQTTDDLKSISDNLSVSERKKAASLITQRISEI